MGDPAINLYAWTTSGNSNIATIYTDTPTPSVSAAVYNSAGKRIDAYQECSSSWEVGGAANAHISSIVDDYSSLTVYGIDPV